MSKRPLQSILTSVVILLMVGCPMAIPPEIPEGLAAGSPTPTSLTISWNTSAGALYYQLFRDIGPNESFGTKVYEGVETTFTDTGLAGVRTYWYKVLATNSYGSSSLSLAVSGTTSLFPIIKISILASNDSFQMGDGTAGPNPTVQQTISYDFQLSKYEITNAQFKQFIEDDGYDTQGYWTANGWTIKEVEGWSQPLSWTDTAFNSDNQPVVGVSWHEAVAYCNWRSDKEGLSRAYSNAGLAILSADGYRLPTEVEWEYAAAKGAVGAAERVYAWGDAWDSSKAVCMVAPADASSPAPVGSKSAYGGDTPQGIADMTGNVWEWCSDGYQPSGSVASGTDRIYFVSDEAGQEFVMRGCAWNNPNLGPFSLASRFNVVGNSWRVSSGGFRVFQK